jgi:hypothetical protein
MDIHPYDMDLYYSLVAAERRCKELAGRLQVKRSGGRGNTAQKMRAAQEAIHLMLAYEDSIHHKVPLTKRGTYFKLAALLYLLATNKRADLTYACTDYLNENDLRRIKEAAL